MTDVTSAKTARRPHHWRRDMIELAALFTAVAVADAIANLIGHQPDGPYLLIASAVALAVTAAFHTWWARRHSHAPPPTGSGPVAERDDVATGLGTDVAGPPAVDTPTAAGPDASPRTRRCGGCGPRCGTHPAAWRHCAVPSPGTGSTSSPCRLTRWPGARSTSSCCARPPCSRHSS